MGVAMSMAQHPMLKPHQAGGGAQRRRPLAAAMWRLSPSSRPVAPRDGHDGCPCHTHTRGARCVCHPPTAPCAGAVHSDYEDAAAYCMIFHRQLTMQTLYRRQCSSRIASPFRRLHTHTMVSLSSLSALIVDRPKRTTRGMWSNGDRWQQPRFAMNRHKQVQRRDTQH